MTDTDNTPLRSRTLMKDGKWLVPPEERPKRWREILPDENETAPIPQKLLDKIVAEDHERLNSEEKVPSSQEPTCGCGKPLCHHGMCTERAKKARRRIAWARWTRAIRISAEGWRCEPALTEAGLVLGAGLFSRDIGEIARVLRIQKSRVQQLADSFAASGVWTERGVVLGNLDADGEKSGDLGFWMIALTGDGHIRLVGTNDKGELLFAGATA